MTLIFSLGPAALPRRWPRQKRWKGAIHRITGHKDPEIHLAMLNTRFPFDAVQMPLNPFDANFHSFEHKVLPELNRRGIAPIGMKPIGGHGGPVQKGVFTVGNHLAVRSRSRPFRFTRTRPDSICREAVFSATC